MMNTSRTAIEHLTEHFKGSYPDLINQALTLVDQVERPGNCRRPKGVDVAQILLDLRVDAETVLAAILSDPVFNDSRPDYDFKQCFGDTVSALVGDVLWLNRLRVYSADMADQPEQPEIVRRMLLSVIRDVRSVLIKLAYRIQRLRQLAGEDYEIRRYIARETLDVYAPLANRLGVSQLKWELEDLAFRYLQPQSYVKLVKSLSATRIQREACIAQFIVLLKQTLAQERIEAKIAGRPKHLYSIWKKMKRKQLSIDELYDLLAVRVIVDKLTTCYAVLGVVHAQWQYIPKEFDDYIANPKANGYQSLHTVVLDPQGHRIEVQIRTQEMHEFAELGVAAHWRYKEGGQHSAAVDNSIASLRRLMEDKEVDEQLLEGFKTELYYDRVYVMTPAGKLVDLVKGSTPLDFAYAIHTEVGHRCRGAKVNGRIVPLTYPLRTGERVEILTAKEGQPNRQWLDGNLGYLKSPRAITKVKNWLRQQSLEQNQDAGRKILDKLLHQWERSSEDIDLIQKHFSLPSEDRLLELVGRGDITTVQLQNVFKKPAAASYQNKSPKPVKAEILVDGVKNLATKIAHCCNPKPGDDIIGYITHRSGITVHKCQCENIRHLSEQKKTQLISVSWAGSTTVDQDKQ